MMSKDQLLLSQSGIRRLPVGATVAVIGAPFVRFKRAEDKTWHEVPRHGIHPRIKSSTELFMLGVYEVKEN
jgi:hypothetical protein